VETAFGSLKETRTHLKTAVVYGYLPETTKPRPCSTASRR